VIARLAPVGTAIDRAMSRPAPPLRPASPALVPPARSASATPLARRMAAQAGLTLDGVTGSGAGGRVTKADVERALGLAPAPATALGAVEPAPEIAAGPAAPVATPLDDGGEIPHRELRHSALRRAQALRLTASKQTVPHFYLAMDCELDALQALRRDASRRLEADGAGPLTLNDLLVRAVALALRRVPDANVAWTESHLRRYERVDVAVAVASERGLVTPVVRDADHKPLRALSAGLRELAERARSGRLRPEEYRGGTCTVSNLGMFGVTSLLPILNPPQACILGLGAAEPRAVVRDGAVVARTMLTCTLAADHRALDGATGARLLAAFRAFVEDPLALLV
jgi:pyruvate dehydrogenase E2 component (dihydrolipoamide acetyltransferase)